MLTTAAGHEHGGLLITAREALVSESHMPVLLMWHWLTLVTWPCPTSKKAEEYKSPRCLESRELEISMSGSVGYCTEGNSAIEENL